MRENSLNELRRLVGLEPLKELFEKCLSYLSYIRENKKNMPHAPRLNWVFVGNPGTGKTKVAHIFGKILYEEGIIGKNLFLQVYPSDLNGEYVGEAKAKTQAVLEQAKGGVLCIDEPSHLQNDSLNCIIMAMTSADADSNTAIFLIDTIDNMNEFLDKADPGLRSRVTNIFVFEDYTPDVLFTIFMQKLGEHEMTEGFKSEMLQIITQAYEHRNIKEWGNAREMENYANAIFREFLNKHQAKGVIDCDCIPESMRINKE